MRVMVDLDVVMAVIDNFFCGSDFPNEEYIRDCLLEDIIDIPRLGYPEGYPKKTKED